MNSKVCREFRVDKAITLQKPKLTSNGYLEADVCLGKVGVLDYWDKKTDSIRRELINRENLFNEESLETIQLVTCTNEHPPVMLTPDNTKKYQVGFVQKGVHEVDERLWGKILITDKQTIDDIQSGARVEVSPAYETELVKAPIGALHNGRAYDYVQTARRYNHLAVVEAGRNGKQVAIKTDSKEFRTDSALVEIINNYDGVSNMATKIKIGKVEFEASEALASAITTRFDSDEGNEKKLMDEIEKLKADNDKLKAINDQQKKDMEEKEPKEEPKEDTEEEKAEKKDAFDKAVATRVELLKKASTVLPKENFDGLSDVEVMKKVITSKDADLNMDSLSEGYVQGRFDAMCESIKAKSKGLNEQGSNFDSANVSDSTPRTAMDARSEMIARYKNA